MAKITIEEVRGLPTKALLVNWYLEFTKAPSEVTLPASNDLKLRCISTEIPKKTNAPLNVEIAGHKVQEPGLSSYAGTLTLTFIETVDNTISNALKNWSEAVWEVKTGNQKTKAEVEAIVTIVRLDNEGNAIRRYKLVGCWLTDYDPGGTLDGTAGEAMKPTMTLAYDYFEES